MRTLLIQTGGLDLHDEAEEILVRHGGVRQLLRQLTALVLQARRLCMCNNDNNNNSRSRGSSSSGDSSSRSNVHNDDDNNDKIIKLMSLRGTILNFFST